MCLRGTVFTRRKRIPGTTRPQRLACEAATTDRGKWRTALRDGKTLGQSHADADSYDLIVVGGGISGLAAAYFYRKQVGPKARVLILDNHDDFGGHAKRNEFQSSNRLIDRLRRNAVDRRPEALQSEAKGLFSELGIEVQPVREVLTTGSFTNLADWARDIF